MFLATLVVCAALQAVPQTTSPAQPRYPVDPATGHAVGAKQMAPEAVKAAVDDGSKMVIIDTRPAEAFAKESIPGAVNIPLAEVGERLSAYPKDTLLVFT
jgi:3-mercaptopyruvate sulfurtransferase SseA